MEVTVPALLQWAGLVIIAAGFGILFGYGVGLVIFGAGVLAFGVAAELEAVKKNGVSKPRTRP